MPKKSISKRMYLLNEGRSHYLEFLRNLTPQILLLTFALLASSKLDFTEFDISNWHGTFIFYIISAGFVLAAYANTSLFHRKFSAKLFKWGRRIGRLASARQGSIVAKFQYVISAIWARRVIEMMEYFFGFYMLQAALAIVIVSGVKAATDILKNI